MNKLKLMALLLMFTPILGYAEPCSDLLDYNVKKLRSSEEVDFCKAFNGKLILAVNTASNCGFTPQFKGLEALYKKYQSKGLVVLGFPSNDFNQEFDDAEETAKVCYVNYGVTFPMLEKSVVTGNEANTFFKKLAKSTGKPPKWNFFKYLINPDGSTVEAFSNRTTPEELDSKINTLLSSR